MLTKKELRQYRKLGKEIDLLREQVARHKNELDRSKKAGVVWGSSPVFPYIYHPIPIADDKPDLNEEYLKTIHRLTERIISRQEEMHKLETYIASIDDSETRQIFMLRYMGPPRSWEQVAHKMGLGYTGDAVRKKHDRFLFKK